MLFLKITPQLNLLADRRLYFPVISSFPSRGKILGCSYGGINRRCSTAEFVINIDQGHGTFNIAVGRRNCANKFGIPGRASIMSLLPALARRPVPPPKTSSVPQSLRRPRGHGARQVGNLIKVSVTSDHARYKTRATEFVSPLSAIACTSWGRQGARAQQEPSVILTATRNNNCRWERGSVAGVQPGRRWDVYGHSRIAV